MGENCITCDVVMGGFGFGVCFTCLPAFSFRQALRGRYLSLHVFTCRVRQPTVSDGNILLFTFSPAALLDWRPSGTPSFAARRKIEEKGVPRRRKLHILRFAFRGKSSVVPLLLLSPPNPLRWALAGPLLAAPLESPGVMFWRILTCYVPTTSQWCV